MDGRVVKHIWCDEGLIIVFTDGSWAAYRPVSTYDNMLLIEEDDDPELYTLEAAGVITREEYELRLAESNRRSLQEKEDRERAEYERLRRKYGE